MIFLAAAEAVRVSDPSSITSLGVGGIFALLVIREVFAYTKGRKTNESISVSKTEFDKHKCAVQYKDNCIEIVKRMDGRFDNIDSQLHEVKDLIKNGN